MKIVNRVVINLVVGLIMSALILFAIEHFGEFRYSYRPNQVKIPYNENGVFRGGIYYVESQTYLTTVDYTTPFKSEVKIPAPQLTMYNLIDSSSDFNTVYWNKFEYYWKGTLKDFMYVFIFLLPCFGIAWGIGNLRLKGKRKIAAEKSRIIKQQEREFVPHREKLRSLKDDGIFSEDDYNKKVEEINSNVILEKVNQSPEYKKLVELKEVGIITENEFEEKIELLKTRFRDKKQ